MTHASGGAGVSALGRGISRRRGPVRHPLRRRRIGEGIARLFPFLIALIAVGCFFSLTDGGRQARQALPISTYAGQFLERLGLGLSEVTLTGQKMTADRAIYGRLKLSDERSVWLIDVVSIRKRLEELPWVAQAKLKRVFPDRLHIQIVERQPVARWNDGRRTVLIDAEGRVLAEVSKADKASAQLPIAYGVGAAAPFQALSDAVSRLPGLAEKIGLYEWTARRRWTLHLQDGRKILLPAEDWRAALLDLMRGADGMRLVDLKVKQLDLRVAGQMTVVERE